MACSLLTIQYSQAAGSSTWSILAETEEPKVLRFLEPNENWNRKVITEGTRNWYFLSISGNFQ